MNYQTAHSKILSLADPKLSINPQRFFKTGKGEYGEGDKFLGIGVPIIRTLAKDFCDLPLSSVARLIRSPYNEERLLGYLILNSQYKNADEKVKEIIFRFYLKNLRGVNNWNLVDTSAPNIVGSHLMNRNKTVLYKLAKSKNLWSRRIAIISTFQFIKQNQFDDTLNIAMELLQDKHDLIHKACGWMLREVGKRNVKILERFLKNTYQKMPRTMLRYAIERFPEKKRQAYLKGEI